MNLTKVKASKEGWKVRKARYGPSGVKNPNEFRRNLSKSHLGQKPWNKGKTAESDLRILSGTRHPKAMKGRSPWNKGLTKESDERVKIASEKLKTIVHTEEWNREVSKSMQGKTPWNKGKRGVQTAWNKGLTKDVDPRVAKIGNRTSKGKEGPRSEETKRKIGRANALSHKGVPLSDYHRKRIGQGSKKVWDSYSPEEKEVRLLKGIFSGQRRPNRAEKLLMGLITNCNLPFKYVGHRPNPELGGKAPDFICEERKKIIELYGDYWHRDDDPQERVKFFKRYGYDTLIIWEHELVDERTVIEKIQTFLSTLVMIEVLKS